MRTAILLTMLLSLGATAATAEPNLRVAGVFVTLPFSACVDEQTVTVYNDGDGTLEWSVTTLPAPWVTVTPTSGSNPPGFENGTVVTISVDRGVFANGVYDTEMRITSNGGGRTIRPRMTVQDVLDLRVPQGEQFVSPVVRTKQFNITNIGPTTMHLSVSATVPWIVPHYSSTSIDCGAYTLFGFDLDLDQLPSETQQHQGRIDFTWPGGGKSMDVTFLPSVQPLGTLGMYMDMQGLDCNINYSSPGLLPVYVVHRNFAGATAVQFSAPKPACWTDAIFLSDTPIYALSIGNSQMGVAIGYGACIGPPMHVLTINYFVGNGPLPVCCAYPVLPDPHVASGEIEVVDCQNNLRFGVGGTSFIGTQAGCICGTVATEETTWGRLKAMYHSE